MPSLRSGWFRAFLDGFDYVIATEFGTAVPAGIRQARFAASNRVAISVCSMARLADRAHAVTAWAADAAGVRFEASGRPKRRRGRGVRMALAERASLRLEIRCSG